MSQTAEKTAKKPATVLKDSEFNWEDPLDLEGELTEEERMIRDSVRGFAQDKLMPRVLLAWREEKVDKELLPEMGALGLLGPTIPEEYGGAGLGYVAYGLIAREMERVDSGYRSTLSVQSSLVMHPIYAYGTEAQQQEISAQARQGRADRLLRPDRARPRLRSRLDGDARREGAERLQAQRHQDVDLQRADRRPLRRLGEARRQDPRLHRRARHQGLLDAEDRGQALAAHLGHRRGRAGRRVRAGGQPAAERVGPRRPVRLPQHGALRHLPGARWAPPSSAGTRARQYVLDRKQFNRPLAANQLVQKKLADMQTEIALGLHGALRLGRMLEAGKAAPPSISLMKRNNCGKALDIARVARDMHGGNGISDEFHVMRVMCNLETVNTYEGTHDIHALILGRAQTGIQAFF